VIQYSLICENRHRFDAWFKSASGFDRQVARGIVTCPVCATSKVNKALMAPSLARGERQWHAEQGPGEHGPGEHGSAQNNQMSAACPASQAAQEQGGQERERERGKISLSAGHPEQAKLAEALRTLRDQITAKADYVGDRFAREARRIHDREVEPHVIYGEATPQEAASLLEDGIDFMPLPTLPEEQN